MPRGGHNTVVVNNGRRGMGAPLALTSGLLIGSSMNRSSQPTTVIVNNPSQRYEQPNSQGGYQQDSYPSQRYNP